MKKSIIYNNRKFTLGLQGKYFFATISGVHTSLHRYKYRMEKEEIPEGWHIHHIDGNCYNNEIDNLQAIDPKEHSKLHLPTEETLKKWQAAGIKAAPVWHASDEGEKWHRQHYEKMKAQLHKKNKRDCIMCGKSFESIRKDGNAFCHNNCKSKWRRKNNPDYKMTNCLSCGIEFKTLKYRPNKYCSKDCKPAPNPFGNKGKPKS